MTEEEVEYELPEVNGLPLWKKKRKDIQATTDNGRTIIRVNKRNGKITEEPRSANAYYKEWKKARDRKREEIELYMDEVNKDIDRLQASRSGLSKEEDFQIQIQIRKLRGLWLMYADARRIRMRKDRLEREANNEWDFEANWEGTSYITYQDGSREIITPTYDRNIHIYDNGEWIDVDNEEDILRTFIEDRTRRTEGGEPEYREMIQFEYIHAEDDETDYKLYQEPVNYSEWEYYIVSGEIENQTNTL